MIRLAMEQDKETVLNLYRAQLGRPFCPWNEYYPTMTEIDFDLGRNALFVRENEEGEIIAAVSLDLDEQVEALTCWSEDLAPGGEVSRLVVRADCQNRGIACEMLAFAAEELKRRGCRSIRYLVDKQNEKALRAYRKYGAVRVGECALFGHEYDCFEKDLLL